MLAFSRSSDSSSTVARPDDSRIPLARARRRGPCSNFWRRENGFWVASSQGFHTSTGAPSVIRTDSGTTAKAGSLNDDIVAPSIGTRLVAVGGTEKGGHLLDWRQEQFGLFRHRPGSEQPLPRRSGDLPDPSGIVWSASSLARWIGSIQGRGESFPTFPGMARRPRRRGRSERHLQGCARSFVVSGYSVVSPASTNERTVHALPAQPS